MCLTGVIGVQSGRTFGGLGRLPGAALAGLLTFLLAVAATYSVSHALYHSLHHDSAANGHFCLVCSFAKAQVSAAPAALVSAVVVLFRLWGIHPANTPLFPGFDYRISSSRAPPLA